MVIYFIIKIIFSMIELIYFNILIIILFSKVFDGIQAVLFLVATNCYDLLTREDETTNRLDDSLDIFENVWTSRYRCQMITNIALQCQIRKISTTI